MTISKTTSTSAIHLPLCNKLLIAPYMDYVKSCFGITFFFVKAFQAGCYYIETLN